MGNKRPRCTARNVVVKEDAHQANRRAALNRRGVKAAGRKVKHGFNLLPPDMKLLNDLFNIGPCFKVLENSRDGHSRILRAHAPLSLSGTLSTAGHWDQSSFAILITPPFIIAL